ncbi:NifB/NifX family molybdenum-iron cluster-binding protein [Psychromonas antarctica]|jgi:predicted Fe-Mo cluster-binding NifX family protein|uniref:NifB/NifX family molybdenum-iron cluster-binding protein n=1 Tax=Psychromonas antarctica TaxID=67573 RepID=UPI001EE98B7E|nr:NifB/NifX family molybdenum-iron cluster-binding protein [Psychromonas antarctica]MCG6200514.1 hypothetical protein [Psychromonas antarctica]
MRFAIPIIDGKLTTHFGHSDFFALVETDNNGVVIKEDELTPPEHKPGVIPDWLSKEQHIDVVLAAGIGGGALTLFKELGIDVIIGCAVKSACELVADYYADKLDSGQNACSH